MSERLDLLQTFARYNAHANRHMFTVLRRPEVESRINDKIEGYFDSIGAILNHLLLADRAWLNRIRGVWGSLDAFKGRPESEWGAPKDIFAAPFEKLEEIESQQEIADQFLLDLAVAAGPAVEGGKVPEKVSYTDSKGNAVEIPAEGALLHLFNHHTHHRGQISQILDEMGIENDFSGLRQIL